MLQQPRLLPLPLPRRLLLLMLVLQRMGLLSLPLPRRLPPVLPSQWQLPMPLPQHRPLMLRLPRLLPLPLPQGLLQPPRLLPLPMPQRLPPGLPAPPRLQRLPLVVSVLASTSMTSSVLLQHRARQLARKLRLTDWPGVAIAAPSASQALQPGLHLELAPGLASGPGVALALVDVLAP